MKYIFFFATTLDIVPVLQDFEKNAPLKFVDPDIKLTPNRAIYLHSSEIPSPGVSTSSTGSGSKSYIVSPRDIKNHVHSFVDVNGHKRWSVNNGDNEDSVMLTLAGIWKNQTLLPGSMSTLHQTAGAQLLMRWFLSALIGKKFIKIDPYLVGPNALDMLVAGKRLAKNAEQSPPEFDLQLPDNFRRF